MGRNVFPYFEGAIGGAKSHEPRSFCRAGQHAPHVHRLRLLGITLWPSRFRRLGAVAILDQFLIASHNIGCKRDLARFSAADGQE